MPAPLSEEVRSLVAATLAEAGEQPDVKAIAAECGVSPTTVRAIAAALGIALRPGPQGERDSTAQRRSEAIGYLRSGCKISEAARKMGVSPATVRYYVRDGEQKKE